MLYQYSIILFFIYLFNLLIGYQANRLCNCSDESPMLNCGKNINSGEMHGAVISTSHQKKKSKTKKNLSTKNNSSIKYTSNVKKNSTVQIGKEKYFTCISSNEVIKDEYNYDVKILVGSNINNYDERIYYHLFHPIKHTTTTTNSNKNKNNHHHQNRHEDNQNHQQQQYTGTDDKHYDDTSRSSLSFRNDDNVIIFDSYDSNDNYFSVSLTYTRGTK